MYRGRDFTDTWRSHENVAHVCQNGQKAAVPMGTTTGCTRVYMPPGPKTSITPENYPHFVFETYFQVRTVSFREGDIPRLSTPDRFSPGIWWGFRSAFFRCGSRVLQQFNPGNFGLMVVCLVNWVNFLDLVGWCFFWWGRDLGFMIAMVLVRFFGWEMLWLELLDGFFVVMGIGKCYRFMAIEFVPTFCGTDRWEGHFSAYLGSRVIW